MEIGRRAKSIKNISLFIIIGFLIIIIIRLLGGESAGLIFTTITVRSDGPQMRSKFSYDETLAPGI